MAPGASHDPIKHRVFRRFAQAIVALQAAILAAQLLLRGPLHQNTIASYVIIGIFGGLLAVQPRLSSTTPLTIIGLGVCDALCLILERTSDNELPLMQLFLFSFPMVATLLSSRRVGFGFLVVACADAVLLLGADGHWGAPPPAYLAVVSKTCFGAALIVLVATFDRERQAARRLAASREQGLRDAVARAEHAAAARTLFLANMSHEIRTPMNGVLGLSRILADEGLPPPQHALARTILESGKSLMNILDDILDLSKLDAGHFRWIPGPSRYESSWSKSFGS